MGVTGIGGFFFRARDPDAIRAWYIEHLGVGSTPHGVWNTEAGASVFAPFPADTNYFGHGHGWMLNLRVEGLDALCDRLRAAGIAIIAKPEWDVPGLGRFRSIHDPDGNPIELWEPDVPA